MKAATLIVIHIANQIDLNKTFNGFQIRMEIQKISKYYSKSGKSLGRGTYDNLIYLFFFVLRFEEK